MLATYLIIAQAIADATKAIHWIDLDKGQLDDPESFNSIITPGVLIGMADINWMQLSGGFQQGEGTITVKTIIRLPAQTHLLDPLVLENLKALTIADDVSKAVQFVPGLLSRTNTKEYPVLTYYVIEETWMGVYKSGPTYAQKPVTVQINPFLFNPNNPANA